MGVALSCWVFDWEAWFDGGAGMEVVLRDQEDLDWLRRQVKAERDVRRRDRLRIVLLALRGFTAPQVANMVECSRRAVYC